MTVLRALTPGEVVEVKIVKARNLGFHMKFMSMTRLVFDNQERFSNITQLLTAIKIEAGWYEDGPIVNGVPSYIPKSISFARMKEYEFHEFYREAVNAACRLLPHLNADDIMEQVISYGD